MDAVAPATNKTLTADGVLPFVPMLRRYLHVLGATADRLDDLAQEVVVVALQKPFADRGPHAVGGLLRAIAKNLVLRSRRTHAARREVELADEVWCEDGGDHDGDDRVEALRACVDALPARSQALLHGAYRDGLGREDLAHTAGLRPDGVKTALRRLRAALRACVERKRGGPS
jgi:DNA-directed RNA polymerase specialized sigma24 family protein